MTEASTPPEPSEPDSSATRKATRRGRTTLSEDLRELAATNPTVREAAQRYDAAMHRLTENIHQVYVSPTTLQCTLSCSGPAPHLREYRAADVRPTPQATAAHKALDAAPE